VHDDHFKLDEQDEVWIRDVAARGWIILSKDKEIRKRPNERQALRDARAMAFFLASGNMTGNEMADAFLKALSKMKRLHRKQPAPFVATVTRVGDVSLLS